MGVEFLSVKSCSRTCAGAVCERFTSAFQSAGYRPVAVRPALVAIICYVLFAAACGRSPQIDKFIGSPTDWHEFQGTWTAAGTRNVLPLNGDRQASIATFDGSLWLAGPSRPDLAFRSEAIVFTDTATGLIGRAVWTDEKGDQAISELRGEGTAKNNKIVGTFVGGTGRYSGATGTYEFSWRFVIENDDGVVQGQSMALHGRVRTDSLAATSFPGRLRQ
jgi:hypothetical protein